MTDTAMPATGTLYHRPGECFPCGSKLRIGKHSARRIEKLSALLLFTLFCVTTSAQDTPVRPVEAVILADEQLWQVVSKQQAANDRTSSITRTGRILLEAQDGGILFEDRSGKISNLTPDLVISKQASGERFTPFTADELADALMQQSGPGFHVLKTPHYVICSNASPHYTEYVGQLLDHLYAEFYEVFADSTSVSLSQPDGPLPILIQSTVQQFQEFARQQHPEINLEETPGYYSIRDNLVLLVDLTGDLRIASTTAVRRRLAAMPRQVSTVVHEAVHQLAFNSGLQIRMADNPLWLSEGLAVWFETAAPRSRLLWSKPGMVSPVHQPVIAEFQQSGRRPLSLSELIGSDGSFLNADQSANAYALSWGLTTYLIRQERRGFDNLLKSSSARKRLIPLTVAERIHEFETAMGKSTDEIERAMIPFVARLRVPK